ncbi:MAG: hypothetical protein FJ161_01600 [Gammaproteobacteria bacterium]|nr:hypothetical protein [Gammaproteobacteria bacterium]
MNGNLKNQKIMDKSPAITFMAVGAFAMVAGIAFSFTGVGLLLGGSIALIGATYFWMGMRTFINDHSVKNRVDLSFITGASLTALIIGFNPVFIITVAAVTGLSLSYDKFFSNTLKEHKAATIHDDSFLPNDDGIVKTQTKRKLK